MKKIEFAWHIGMTRRPEVIAAEPEVDLVDVASGATRLSWLRMAPLGLPVVPEV